MSLTLIPEYSTVFVDPAVFLHGIATPMAGHYYEEKRKVEKRGRKKADDEYSDTADEEEETIMVPVVSYYQKRFISDDCRGFLSACALGRYRVMMTTYQITGLWNRLEAFKAWTTREMSYKGVTGKPVSSPLPDDFAEKRIEMLLRSHVEILPITQRDHRFALRLRSSLDLPLPELFSIAAALRVSVPTLGIAVASDRYRQLAKLGPRRIKLFRAME